MKPKKLKHGSCWSGRALAVVFQLALQGRQRVLVRGRRRRRVGGGRGVVHHVTPRTDSHAASWVSERAPRAAASRRNTEIFICEKAAL